MNGDYGVMKLIICNLKSRKKIIWIGLISFNVIVLLRLCVGKYWKN